jgi:hypothetical protein
MHIHLGILLSLLLCLPSIANAAAFHTFKDTQGREMQAKITRVSGEDVYIQRSDGLNTKVKRSIFSKKDQTHIAEWAHNTLLESGILEVQFTTTETDKRKSSSGGIQREDYKVCYNVRINNSGHEDFSDVRVEYLILKFQDILSATKRSEGNLKRFKGSAELPRIPAREESSASTEDIPMLKSKLESGYIWANGAKKTSKDKLEGIWVKIYIGDKLVHEVSKPENMMRTEKW